MSAPNTFEAGERLTWQAGPPTFGGTPTGMLMTVTPFPGGTTTSLSTPFPGTLVYDFTVTDFYVVQLVTSLTGLFPASTWTVTCGLPPPVVVPPSPVVVPALEPPKPNPPARIIVCGSNGPRADGKTFGAFDVFYSQWADAESPYHKLAPARYAAAAGGATCDALPGYAPTGQFTDGFGSFVTEQNTKLGDGVFAPYPVWVSAKA
jgi:hypothetical protein